MIFNHFLMIEINFYRFSMKRIKYDYKMARLFVFFIMIGIFCM